MMSYRLFIMLVCFLAKALGQSDSLEMAVKGLVELIQEPRPAEGEPFLDINGPNPDDKVCIVGAGPAGIHMAQSLKKRNFEDIVIFEKTDRVGGKSYDVTVNGTVNYMSTVFVLANYFDTLVPLAKEYGIGDLVKAPSPNLFKYNSGSQPGSKLRTIQYILDQLQSSTDLDALSVLKRLFLDIGRYVKIHREMFGAYKGELMPKPSMEVFHRIRGTFLEFLQRENLETLVPLFLLSHTMPGYGYIDEIGALYGLMWNDPVYLLSVCLRTVGKDEDPLSVYTFRNGFERIWETIVEVEKLKIHFNSNILKITRNSKGATIYLNDGYHKREESCDFLIWAAPVDEYLKTVDFDMDELMLFKPMQSVSYSSTLVEVASDIRNGPYTGFLENIRQKTEHGVVVEVSSSGITIPNIREPEALDLWDENNSEAKIATVVQLGREFDSVEALNDILINHYLQNFNATRIEILLTLTWKYFPRWSPIDVNKGRHWMFSTSRAERELGLQAAQSALSRSRVCSSIINYF